MFRRWWRLFVLRWQASCLTRRLERRARDHFMIGDLEEWNRVRDVQKRALRRYHRREGAYNRFIVEGRRK